MPTTLYRVGGVKLRKELVFQHYDDRVLIRYTLVDAHSETKLRFRPFLAFRSVKQFTHENPTASREYEEIENGIRTRMYAGSKKPTFVFHPDWYRDLEYPKEQERGYASREDLYVPGYFELPIKKGESIIFAASTSKSDTATLAPIFEEEREKRIPRDNFVHCLYNAAHQFLNRSKEGENYILAGYPWFKCRGRDTFIALPGLTLPGGERGRFEEVMETAAKGLRQLMTGQPMTVSIYEMEKPDVGLWAVWTIQQYAKAVGRERAHKLYGSLAGELVDYVIRGGHPNLRLDDNGLLYAEGREEPITWMNSTHGLYRRDQRPMVQRPAVRGLDETGVWRRRRGRPTGPVGRPDEGGLCRDLPQRVWLSLRLCRWGHDGLEREAEHDLCRGLRLLAPRRATEEGHRRYLHARTAHAQGTADALAQERGIQPDVCRTADAEGLRLPSGHGMALAGGILYRGLSETLQAVAHQLRGATDGGLRGPGAPTLRGHATRTLRRQPALQGTRGHLLRHERGRGAARQRIARKV